MAVAADVSDSAAVSAMMATVERELGPVDVLVNNAGLAIMTGIDDLTEEQFDRTIAVNLKSAFLCTRAVLPGMRARKAGRIFNVVSLGGVRVLQLAGLPYTASKFAQSAIGTFANLETLPDGISVTNIHPGETETPLVDKRPVPPSAEQRARMLKPEDIAAMVVAVAKLPPRATVPEIVITPRHMPLN